MSKVLVPGVLAPIAACVVAALGTLAAYTLTQRLRPNARNKGFRIGQIGSSSLLALAHGTNDAQKTMGVITLALIANGSISSDAGTPDWVILSCATAIALGTASGGFRVIRTLGHGLVTLEPPAGLRLLDLLDRGDPRVDPLRLSRCPPRTSSPAASSGPASVAGWPRSAGESPDAS